jgi:TDG/mug DNA glycosylase family protein
MTAVVTAVDLARRLHIEPKTFRSWLRRQAAAGHPILRRHQHQGSWEFTSDEADQLTAEYRRSHGQANPAMASAWSSPVPGSSAGSAGMQAVQAPGRAQMASEGSFTGCGHQIQVDWFGSTVTTLADLLRPGLAAVTVGINPAPISVAAGHYYQGGAGQTFYRRLAAVGLLPPGSGYQDDRAYAGGIGFSDMVKRPTSSAAEVHSGELTFGRALLEDKLKETGTPLVIFTFKKAATALLGDFAGHGLLSPSRRLAGARVFVMPGPYEQSDRVAAALDELKRHLDP